MQIAQGYMGEEAFVAFLQQAATADPLAGLGLGAVAALAFVGGLAMNLTPCVLPMVPVNLMVIGKSWRRGLWYAFGILLAYGALGVVSAVFGFAFGALQSSVWFNGAVGVLFAVMGLALVGVFSIDFSRFRAGLRGGAFFLGVISALLAGACVAPILVSVLLLTSKLFAEGNVWALGLPFAVGLGLAAPWPLLGAGVARVLPRPGAWMKWVNRGFAAFVFLLSAHYLHLAFGDASPAETGSSALEMDVAAYRAQGLDGVKRPVLVDCWATWCKNCAAMERMMRESPKVRAALAGYTVIRLQAEDIDELRELPGFADVRGLPAFVIVP